MDSVNLPVTCRRCQKPLPDGAAFCPWCGKEQQITRHKTRRPNNTGTVYRLQGKRARPWVAAKGKTVLGYHETKRAALEALERFSGTPVSERINWTFAQVYEHWKAEHFKGVGESTKAQYEISYEKAAALHKKRFRDLHTEDFQAVLDACSSQSVNTVAKHKQLLTSMSDWAIREQIISVNFASFAQVRGREARDTEPMTDEEIQRIQKAAATSEAARIVCMLLATGMRIGELFALPVADCHEDHVIGGEKTEAGRGRIIPIRPEGREHFRYFEERATGPLLLSGYQGQHTPANFRKRDYAPLLQSLGIDKSKTPRATRTTYTTRAVAEGLAPAVAQKVLGHADFDTTQKYYNKPDAAALVQAVEEAAKKDEP